MSAVIVYVNGKDGILEKSSEGGKIQIKMLPWAIKRLSGWSFRSNFPEQRKLKFVIQQINCLNLVLPLIILCCLSFTVTTIIMS